MLKRAYISLVIIINLILCFSGKVFPQSTAIAKDICTGKYGSETQKELTSSCLSCFKESIQLIREHGESLWKDLGKLDPRVNIITPHYEFFFGDEEAPPGYELFEKNTILGEPIFFKKREYRHKFTQTVNSINEKPALFISSKEIFEETYSRSPLYKVAEDYIFTIIQKYFHLFLLQTNNSLASMILFRQADVKATGEIYPYLDFINAKLLEIEGEELLKSLEARDRGMTLECLNNYLRLKDMRLRQMQEEYQFDLKKYENWVEWYDGLAKYTEIKIAMGINTKNYKPFQGMFRVPNFKNYGYIKNKYNFELQRLRLTKNSLIHSAIGMTEALILDKLNIPWKDEILKGDKSLMDILYGVIKKNPKKSNFY